MAFRPPKLDGSLTLPEIYDSHLESSPEHPLFVYADPISSSVKKVLWGQAVRAIHRIAWMVSRQLKSTGVASPPAVVAIIAASDTITYFLTMVGIMRAGSTVFTISPRNSPDAIAHLLAKTGAAHILVGKEPMFAELVSKSLSLIDAQSKSKITISEMPSFADIFPTDESQGFEKFPPMRRRLEDPALMLHSSGSTAFPKPITWTHQGVLYLAKIPSFGVRNLTGEVIGFHAVPMFHGLGILMINAVPATGLILSVFAPKSPAQLPTPDDTFNGAVMTNSKYVFSIPLFLEIWSRDPEKVKIMQGLGGLMYGGGPLNKEVGDFLASKGIHLFTVYGASEGGVMSEFLPANPGMDWEYFTPSVQCAPAYRPYSDEAFEIILVANDDYKPAFINTKWNGHEAFATNDLLLPHPTKSGLWKIYGRADDQIMLSTGEKTNPGPLESILLQDPRVMSAVMFGRGRFQNGVLIDPKAAHAFDPADDQSLAEFRNAIWPTVERMNQFAPTHSRLFKEMILVASPSKPFTYTAKGTARRQAIINAYKPEIDALYVAIEVSTQTELEAPEGWGHEDCLTFVRRVVLGVMKHDVPDDVDIFQHGCDSLQATWIRNSIMRALRNLKNVAPSSLGSQFVYEAPTIASLAEFVEHAAADTAMPAMSDPKQKIVEMKAMVTKYSHNFPSHSASPRANVFAYPDAKDVILLTGGTGGLGCYLLAHLIASAAVAKVYVLNRASGGSKSVRARQTEALLDRGLDPSAVDSPKVVLLEGDFGAPDFGLGEKQLSELRDGITHVIHNAWRVNFNLSLASFELSVKAVRNLVDLSLRSPRKEPPRLMFVSSIGVVLGAKEQPVPEVFYDRPEVAVGTGYAESKWVAESILYEASKATALKPIVVRLGQLSGGLNGCWNQTEWLPSLACSSAFLKAVPDCAGNVTWIPVDLAASALVDMRDSAEPMLHLAHPRPMSWTSIFEAMSRNFDVPLIPYAEWFKKLEESLKDKATSEVENMRRNPASRLLDFFRAGIENVESSQLEPPGIVRLSMAKAVEVVPSLMDIRQLGEADVGLWLAYWSRVGLL